MLVVLGMCSEIVGPVRKRDGKVALCFGNESGSKSGSESGSELGSII